jgi:hypothetical protein
LFACGLSQGVILAKASSQSRSRHDPDGADEELPFVALFPHACRFFSFWFS